MSFANAALTAFNFIINLIHRQVFKIILEGFGDILCFTEEMDGLGTRNGTEPVRGILLFCITRTTRNVDYKGTGSRCCEESI